MTTLEVILIVVAAVLGLALVWALMAWRRDRRLLDSRESMVEGHRQRVSEATVRAERTEADMHQARADTTEELAEERSARHRAEAELHEARARIAALEQREGAVPEEMEEGGRARSLFRRETAPEGERAGNRPA
jgi:F0F1-type ATP synthase membrane subunit b/b'